MQVHNSKLTALRTLGDKRLWLALAVSALALLALSNSAGASLPAPTVPKATSGTPSIQTGSQDQPFDCTQIEAQGINKQMNIRAGQILAQCDKAGPAPQPPNPAGNVARSPAGRPRSPFALGSGDQDVIVPEGTYSHFTQSTSMSWAHGNSIIVSYEDTRTAGACYADYSYSTDGGATWTAAEGTAGNNGLCTGHGTNYGDPLVVYNAARNLWFLGNLTSGCGGQGIGLWTTTDASPGTLAVGACAANTGFADLPSMWVDNNPSSPHYGRMYVSFNNFATGSGELQAVYSDDGTTWSSAATISPTLIRNVGITGDLAGSGTVYLAGMDEGGGGLGTRTNLMYRSTDGGVTWSSAISMGPSFAGPGRSLCSGNNYWVCMFGNNTWRHMGWGQPAAVGNIVSYDYTQCGGNTPCSAAADKGDVYYVRSTDAGLTWGTPVKLNTDAGTAQQWQPSLAAAASGALLASWYDSREVNGGADLDCTPGAATQTCYRRWGRISLDGGATWQTDDTIGDALSPLPAQPDAGLPPQAAENYNRTTCDTTEGLTMRCFDHWTDGRLVVDGVAQRDVFLDKIDLGQDTSCDVPNFAPASYYSLDTEPSAVAVGDFNGDNIPDLVTANYRSDNVAVLLGDGRGGFNPAGDYPAGTSPSALAVGDFKPGGGLDLAVANEDPATVSVLVNDGAGGFVLFGDFAVGVTPLAVTVGDFNSDNYPDLVTANAGAASVSVLLNDGAGGFVRAGDFAVGGNPQGVAVGDFNGDGHPDLAATSQGSGTGLMHSQN